MFGVKSIILSGSHGFLMEPLSLDRPKSMLPLVNKPILEYIVDSLKQNGQREIIICIHYQPSTITNHFKDGKQSGVNISYLNEEKLSGSAGPIKKLEKQFNDTFLVIYGDSLFDIDLNDLIKFHKTKKSIATIVYHEAPDPTTCGIFLTNEDGRITRFQEKPKREEVFSNKASAAIYALEPEILQYIPADKAFDFTNDLFPLLIEENKSVYGYSIGSGYRYDIGTIAQYRSSHIDILEGMVKKNIEGKRIDANIWIGDDTWIDTTARLNGPIVIGKNCKIGKNVIIEKNTVIGDNVEIGDETVIRGSILWENTQVGSGVKLEECIIGAQCSISNHASILPNAVLGSSYMVGERITVEKGIKLFPSKDNKTA